MARSMPRADEVAAELAFISSCFQPPIYCVDSIARDSRRGLDIFRIHTPVDLKRVSPDVAKALVRLLKDLPRAVLDFYGYPKTNVLSLLEELTDLAKIS